ncbi:hypothetical protein P691DRAFT_775584 [Macrolepiota fuliginosa MF-IS2]|uniref:F-box domain-containing protein n=1 Tax=Macrolepiota fuliginosa MF-IS2 TaxID=1400762 RepID=A0A9P6C196_9AGAR|nr:hypothetical protein P691DRAFT_775584 [Macrolepiota fuliginosa MF-IS2]
MTSSRLIRILRRLSRLLLLSRSFRRRHKCGHTSQQPAQQPTTTPQVQVQPANLKSRNIPHDLDGSRERLQQRQQRLEDDVSRLRVCNDQQPVAQLPCELLHQIFLKGSLPPDASKYPALVKKYCTTKRSIAQVCYRWRTIALEYPDMWCSAVDLTDGDRWIGEVLWRSRDRPINVFILPGAKEESITLVFRTNRIRGLYANVQEPKLARKVLHHIRELGGLEELHACGTSHSRSTGLYESLPEGGSPTAFPSKLRRLYLNGSSIALPTYTVASLTCLYVTRSWGSKSAFEWLTVIRRFPHLQELSLANCIKAEIIAGGSSGEEFISFPFPCRPSPLPHLRELELRGQHYACGAVFRGLVVPSSCVLRLETYDASEGPTLNAVIKFLKSDQSCITSSRSSANRSLYFKASSSQVYLQISQEGAVGLDIHLKYIGRQADISKSTAEKLLVATDLKFQTRGGFSNFTMSISRQFSTTPQFDTWFRIIMNPLLASMGIKSLRLQETTAAYELLRLLEKEGADVRWGGNNGTTPTNNNDCSSIPFPGLQQITLAHVDFGNAEGIFIPDRLVSFISRHSLMGAVSLVKCKGGRSLVERLNRLGAEVVVVEFETI